MLVVVGGPDPTLEACDVVVRSVVTSIQQTHSFVVAVVVAVAVIHSLSVGSMLLK